MCGYCMAGVDRDREAVIDHKHCAGCPLVETREEYEDEVSELDIVALREGLQVPFLSLL